LLAEVPVAREALEAAVTRWNNWTRLQPVQFEWENEPQLRDVRLVSQSPRVGEPVRLAVAGVEVEARIEAVESSLLRVRVGRRLF
jgi:hypothetical protein